MGNQVEMEAVEAGSITPNTGQLLVILMVLMGSPPYHYQRDLLVLPLGQHNGQGHVPAIPAVVEVQAIYP